MKRSKAFLFLTFFLTSLFASIYFLSEVGVLKIGLSGGLKWHSFARGYGNFPLIFSDLDSDNKLEVIVSSIEYIDEFSFIHVFNGEDGSLLWNQTIRGFIVSSPVLGDVDGDGKLEVVTANYDGYVYVFNGEDGSLLWNQVLHAKFSSLALSDVDGDGKLEVAITSVGRLEGYSFVYVFNGEDGSLLWNSTQRAKLTGPHYFAYFVLGDVDGDSRVELVVGGDDYNVRVYNGEDGSLLWNHSIVGDVNSFPALGDVDGDGKLEVLIANENGYVYVFDGRDGSLSWSYSANVSFLMSPVLADLDGDGKVELVVVGENYPSEGSDVFVFGFPGFVGRGAVLWRGARNYDDVDGDYDGLPSYWEVEHGLDPTRADSDGDGFLDGVEVAWCLDPLNPLINPVSILFIAGVIVVAFVWFLRRKFNRS